MQPKLVYLVRHGETDYNRNHRWQGQLDIPLNATGRDQATRLAHHLRDTAIDACYSSDLSRAYETAQLALQFHDVSIQSEPRLREMHVGIFQGKTRAELQVEHPSEYAQWNADDGYAPPDGEARNMLRDRAYAAWLDIISTAPYENIMIVTHGGTLRMMLPRILQNMSRYIPRFPNTSVTLLEREWATSWVMVLGGATPHLD